MQAAPTHVLPVWKKGIDAGVIDLSSPLTYDIDGDGKLEIIGATTYWDDSKTGAARDTQKPRIYILRANGDVYQMIDIQGGGTVESSVAIGRLFGPQGDLYLLVGVGAEAAMDKWVKNPGSIQTFRLNPTTKLFEFSGKFDTRDDGPNPSATDKTTDPVFSTPCLADIDNDGVLEIFFGAWDRWIYCIKPIQASPTILRFTKVFDYHNADTVWSSGAAADVNGDGFPELIIGADISKDPAAPPSAGFEGGFLYCFDRTGKQLWRNNYPESIYSSPAIADVDGDGKLEVVVGTSDSYGLKSNSLKGNFIVCVDGATGVQKWRTTTNGHGWASPAVGNLLNKTNPATNLPILQVACGSSLYDTDFTKNQSLLYLLDGDGSVLWAKKAQNREGSTFGLRGSPIIVNWDFNADGVAEPLILQPTIWDIAVFNAQGTQIRTLRTEYSLFASPVGANVDGDGKLSIFAACSSVFDRTKGYVYRFDALNLLGERAGTTNDQPWGMFHRSPERDGFLTTPPELVVPPVVVLPIPVTGGPGPINLPLSSRSTDGTTGPCNVVVRYVGFKNQTQTVVPENKIPDWITIAQLQNDVAPQTQAIAQVTIDRDKIPQLSGTHTFEVEFQPTNKTSKYLVRKYSLPVTFYAQILSVPGVPAQLGTYVS